MSELTSHRMITINLTNFLECIDGIFTQNE